MVGILGVVLVHFDLSLHGFLVGWWWEVVGAEVTNDPDTKALVDAREIGRAKQRFYY